MTTEWCALNEELQTVVQAISSETTEAGRMAMLPSLLAAANRLDEWKKREYGSFEASRSQMRKAEYCRGDVEDLPSEFDETSELSQSENDT